MPSSSTPRTTPVGSIRWRSISRSFNERSSPRMTFLPWPISNSAFSRFRSITSARHLPSNGPSHAPTCSRSLPDSTADDWLQQPDRQYVTVILNQTTKPCQRAKAVTPDWDAMYRQLVTQLAGPVEVETPQLGRVMFPRPSEAFLALNYLRLAQAELNGVRTAGTVVIGHDRGLWSRRGCC